MAEHLEVAQSYISEVEAGKRVRVPLDRMARWLSFLSAKDADRLEALRLAEAADDTPAAEAS